MINDMSTSVGDKLTSFFDQYPARAYEPGHILIHAEANPEGIYFLQKGAVRQYVISDKGDEVILNSFKPGAYFPMSWALSHVENHYFFEASESITVSCAPAEEVVDFLSANPDIAMDLLSRMYTGLDGLLSRMTHLLSGTAYERIVNELVLHTKRQTKTSDALNTTLPLKEYELGKYCGLTKETISREFKKLKQKGLVEVGSAGILVTDLKKLISELE